MPNWGARAGRTQLGLRRLAGRLRRAARNRRGEGGRGNRRRSTNSFRRDIGRGAPNLIGASALLAAEGNDELTDGLNLLLDVAVVAVVPFPKRCGREPGPQGRTILVGCQSPPTWPNSSARSEAFAASPSSSADEIATPCTRSAKTMREMRVRYAATGSWSGRYISRRSACKDSAVAGTDPAVEGGPESPARRTVRGQGNHG